MLSKRIYRRVLIVVGLTTAMSANAFGQFLPWDTFIDPLSTSECDIVNAENAELVVLSDTGQLVIVTGRDVILQDTFVTVEGDVFYLGQPVGFITYEADGDGFQTVWWVSLTGQVVNVDGFTGQPSVTDSLPADFLDVPCDACDFWDDPSVCAPLEPTDPITINLCGTSTALAMAMTFAGLTATGLVRRRRYT